MPRAEGEEGPLNWAALDSPANYACATGTRQSPIDMVDGVFTTLEGSELQLAVNDMPDGAEFENLGTTVEVITQGGTLTVADKQFELKQFHFHLPSEHLDNGTSQAMEMHMVFQSAAEEIAVIGVYIAIADTAAPAPAEKRSPRLLPPSTTSTPNQNSIPASPPRNNLLYHPLITTPGTKTKTPPLIMSEVVNLLKANAFQLYSITHYAAVQRGGGVACVDCTAGSHARDVCEGKGRHWV
ncbi:hypothetical protein N0V88_000753 [Collariella sp. IMI 366227]|nr:hypothetical protein N0V88_000753 [Collariella sp. IMI 366227]